MDTLATITTVGNSAAVLIPKRALREMHLRAGKKVRVIFLPEKTLGEVIQEGKPLKKSADDLSKILEKELRWE